MTTDAAPTSTSTSQRPACYRHPDVRGGVLVCRHCERTACLECRTTQYDSGIPMIVCASCMAKQVRAKRMRQLGIGLAIVLALVLVVGIYVSPYAFMVSVPIGLLFLYMRIRWMMQMGRTAGGPFTLPHWMTRR